MQRLLILLIALAMFVTATPTVSAHNAPSSCAVRTTYLDNGNTVTTVFVYHVKDGDSLTAYWRGGAKSVYRGRTYIDVNAKSTHVANQHGQVIC